jgi:P27 family predicted phage terminase small subunit
MGNLKHSPRGREQRKVKPKDTTKVQQCPATLHGEARKEWNRLAPQLYDLGLLTELDRNTLQMLCESWAQLQEANAVLKKEGYTVMGANGGVRPHPAVKIARDAQQTVRILSEAFGMTPAARGRVAITKKPKDDTGYWDEV